jgi:hypothetical protein
MQDLSIHKAGDLSANAKALLEQLLGRDLADDEEVGIWASRPHSAPTGEARQAAWRQLREHFDRIAPKTGATTEELEQIVDQVSDEVRHGLG